MGAVNHRTCAATAIVAALDLSSIALFARVADVSFEKMPSSYAALTKMKPMDVFT